MFRNVLLFELRYRLRQPSTYIYFGILFAIAFVFLSVQETFAGPSTGGKIFKNAPDTLANFMLGGSTLAMFITAAIVGTPVYRDVNSGISPLLYTTPLGKFSYLSGKFLASLFIIWLIMSGLMVGAILGSMMPWLDPTKYGPFRFEAYWQPLLWGAFVNAFFAGCIFFAAYALTRNALVVYLGGIVLFLLYNIAGLFTTQNKDEHLAALLDPFGLDTRAVVTKYWTIAERNTLLVPLHGEFLQNRLLWSGIGLALLAVSFVAFRMSAPASSGKPTALEPVPALQQVVIRRSPQVFGAGTSWWQWWQLTKVQFLNVVKSRTFLALVLFGVVNILFGAYYRWKNDGANYPVTYDVLALLNNNFNLFFLIIITLYAGEVVWRERELRLHQVFDVLPMPNWVPFASKLAALVLVQVVLYGVIVTMGVLIQLYKSYDHVQPLLYAQDFVLQLAFIVELCVLAMVVQTVANNKYVGYTLMILFYVFVYIAPDALGLHHVMLKYDGYVPYTYSDMNGYGHFVGPLFWVNFYYLAWAVLLAVVCNLLWVRGTETSVRHRSRLAGQRLVPAARWGAVAAVAAVLGVGGYVFWNTNLQNEYLTTKLIEGRRAGWETKYKHLARVAQPKIVNTELQVDLYPTATPRGYHMRGALTLLNRTARPLDTLLVNYDNSHSVQKNLTLSRPNTVLLDDPENGFRIYRLAQPLAPGDSLQLHLDMRYAARGFSSRPQDTGVFSWANISPEDRLTANGTFLDGTGVSLGYDARLELEDDDVRERNHLKPKERFAKLNDAVGRQQHGFTLDADYTRFDITVSTDPDQTAVAPGYLQKTWLANGRRYFHYQMDAPMSNMFNILSARYQVHRAQWHDPTTGRPVAIEIYHDAQHPYNVAHMADALKQGLTYYTKAFGPYQFRQVRVLEFPRYKAFAQSFPNTISTSESAGFVEDLRDKNRPDMVYFITNHELGHQWWGHQVVGGNVQGSSMLSESLAEYSALMTCKHAFTGAQMQRIMRGELDRYLKGRRDERKKELPLMLVENQPYIHYYKGGMVFYALQDYLGEDTLNAAIRRYLTANRYQTKPYPNTATFMGYLRRATPDSLQYLLHDMFETITLFENRVENATYTKRPDGRYTVRLTLEAAKMRADSLGNETPVKLNDWVDVGIFGPDKLPDTEHYDATGQPLYLRKVHLTQPKTELVLVVDKQPAKAGLDPYHKLIDRHYMDNVKAVEVGAAPAVAKR
ncbi:hypothetical protein MUN82_16660 [Hymenobacter aerilatus]|uniref:Peptidase M1 membrane alanine aminopeptidase domain-containing protein n=1 Tax=Hymenobacter aerilatus TaxID=2932251 RepID=A0A8T9SS43_9BACT|nr:M1 family aminopeptidase [Hymenobacter aerilatus]UOR04567.1 hypothetical protein MUN82_16660 [Hymenobacter aerilatus]